MNVEAAIVLPALVLLETKNVGWTLFSDNPATDKNVQPTSWSLTAHDKLSRMRNQQDAGESCPDKTESSGFDSLAMDSVGLQIAHEAESGSIFGLHFPHRRCKGWIRVARLLAVPFFSDSWLHVGPGRRTG
jgi:hypothetical protein